MTLRAETTNGTPNKDVNGRFDDGGEEPQATSRYELWSTCVFMSNSLAGFNPLKKSPYFFNSTENTSKSLHFNLKTRIYRMQHLSADSLEARSEILRHVKKNVQAM
uniref:Uncharacterized protein n=1 Tax=Glossina austeni TaxID=7395 RepID=A0A1A9VHX6_GLOAU